MASGQGPSMAACRHLGEVVLLLCTRCAMAHPCEAEVASACPDSPRSDLVSCLKDASQHEQPTEISSDCTDFMALNSACAEEIEQLCDEEFFADETMPCLMRYRASDEDISEKCQSVMRWALPVDEEEAAEAVTDELGMSDKDRQDKEEWREKRKKEREAAIERMKMKEVDAKKEAERRELEKFKEENPEAFEDMKRQQEEEKRQQAEQKKRERLLKAAWERKKREAEEDTDDSKGPSPPSRGPGKTPKVSGSWYSTIAALIVLAILGVIGYTVATGTGKPAGSGGARSGKGKKKR